MAVPPAPVLVPAKGHSLRVSCQSDNDRMIMRWYPGLCTDLLAFTLHPRKTQKTSASRQSVKAVRPVIASNGVSSLQMRSVELHSMSGRKKEGKKERTGGIYTIKVSQMTPFLFLCPSLSSTSSFPGGSYSKLSHGTIFTFCLCTFILFWLTRISMSVEMSQFIFHVLLLYVSFIGRPLHSLVWAIHFIIILLCVILFSCV